MALDPSIPFRAAQAAGLDLAGIYKQADDRKAQEQQMQVQRDTLDMQKQRLQLELQQHVDQMDKAKRDAVEKGLEDVAAAVQWADTPDKWAVVQRHYGQYDPALAAVPFEHREQALVDLGHMGDYLKSTAPKVMAIEAGGSLAAVDPRTGQPTFTVLPNPGGMQPGAPAQAAPPYRPTPGNGATIIQQATARGYILPDELNVVRSQLGPNGQGAMQGWLQQNHVKVVRRTGTAADGRKVLEFDDGTVDYAN